MNMVQTLRTIAARWPELQSSSTEEPVFLLAGGWRSGSTLLQRMLMRHCLVWGEPFGRAMPIDLMMRQLRVITEQWPPDGVFLRSQPPPGADLGREWVANLFPPMPALLQAQRAFFTTWLQAPAVQMGFQRWGLKEVRLSAEHAMYLQWLFPRAKLLFLYRDPYACYRSFKGLKLAYRSWPDQPIDSPERFGQLWVELVRGFLEHGPRLGAQHIKYEELCAADFEPTAINEYLGFPLELSVREVRVGTSGKQQLSDAEASRLEAVVGPVAAALGYQPS